MNHHFLSFGREKLTGFHGQQPTEGQWWTSAPFCGLLAPQYCREHTPGEPFGKVGRK